MVNPVDNNIVPVNVVTLLRSTFVRYEDEGKATRNDVKPDFP